MNKKYFILQLLETELRLLSDIFVQSTRIPPQGLFRRFHAPQNSSESLMFSYSLEKCIMSSQTLTSLTIPRVIKTCHLIPILKSILVMNCY